MGPWGVGGKTTGPSLDAWWVSALKEHLSNWMGPVWQCRNQLVSPSRTLAKEIHVIEAEDEWLVGLCSWEVDLQ